MRSIDRRVGLLFRMGSRYLNDALAGSGISSGTAPLLLELRDGKDRSQAAIAAAVGVDKAHVARAIRCLKRAGYVEVVPAPADSRSVLVSLTPEGRAITERVERAMRAWVTLIGRGVGQESLDQVEAVFDRFYANAKEYFASRNE